jgi:hypothetical protein
MSDLVHHLETHLGKISAGWSRDAEGLKRPVQVVLFERGPIPGTRTLATLGLSDVPLRIGDSGKRVRQVLVMLVREEFGYRNLPGVLHQVASEALAKDRGYLRGEVVSPRGPLVEGSAHEALYVAVPVYFPDEFHVFQPAAGEPIVFAWLVPHYARGGVVCTDPWLGGIRRQATTPSSDYMVGCQSSRFIALIAIVGAGEAARLQDLIAARF